MCGLYGTFGSVPNRNNVFTHLAFENMARGTHSTGYADISTTKNSCIIRKGPTDALSFLPFFKIAKGNCLLGHTRFATCGKINTENAHPWKFQNLVGAHNGVVMNEWAVEKYMSEVHNDSTRYEVDSQYLLHMVDRYGHMGNATGMLNLVFWHFYRRSLNFYVHNNPMNLAISSDYKWLAWSSDKSHLERVMKESKLEDAVFYSSLKDETAEFVLTKDNVLELESGKVPFDMEYRKKELETRSKNYYSGHNAHWYGYDDYYDDIPFDINEDSTRGKVFRGIEGSTWELTSNGWKQTFPNGDSNLYSPKGELVEINEISYSEKENTCTPVGQAWDLGD